MAYKAVAVTFKSKGGKGSRGVALFSHGPGEATVHLVEDGQALCGIKKNYKKSWRLTDEEARQGHARRPGWKLSVCKNCMTHLDSSSKTVQQKGRSDNPVEQPTRIVNEKARPNNKVDPPSSSPFSLRSTYFVIDSSHKYRQTCPDCGSRIGLHQAKRRVENEIFTLLKCPSCSSLWAHHGSFPDSEDIEDWVSVSNENDLETSATREKINEATKTKPEIACFIATAAYGTPQSDEIDTLRDFRDDVMAGNIFGDRLIDLYYSISPRVAEWISRTSRRRALSRTLIIKPSLIIARQLL